MTPEETAWVAGLLEGEGCFLIKGNGGLAVNCTMTDRDVIQRLCDVVGYGSVRAEALREGRKQAYTWRIGNRREVLNVVTAILPYMGTRRSNRIGEMLAHNETRPPRRQEKGRVQHGTRAMYGLYSCRCQPCKDAENTYSQDYHRRKKHAEEAAGAGNWKD
ncbi:hypothetical protein [Nocardia thailandica]|uniref:hypothetical protein n=1 Tax=Nocardia thailandica TaxID=257275 RepID=UPI0012F87F60|nr:hypothetical protein [Nocardia thailandica]